MASTKLWYPENASVKLYDHEEEEDATGDLNGTNSVFELANTPSDLTGIDDNGSALTQYVDASGSIARRDVLIKLEEGETKTTYDTTANGSIDVVGSELIFETAPGATNDKVLASYAHNKADKTLEVTNVSESGGERAVEFITVYGGTKIKQTIPQESFEVSVETLKGDLDFAEMVNGQQVTESVSGSGSVYTVTGTSTRKDKAILVDNDDPDTNNKMKLIYWNVSGVSKELEGAAEEYYTETVSFESKPEDKTEIYWEL